MYIPERIRENMTLLGIESPTPIQMESVPCVLSNRDVILQSNTGSGKTFAYVFPFILLQLDYYNAYKTFTDYVVLVIVPNRELAIQIETFVKALTANTVGVRTALVIGGDSRDQQIYRLHSNCNFIIATPGRLVDIYNKDKEWMQSLMRVVRAVVLDEADQLMKSDFEDQTLSILQLITSSCLQQIIVSATVTQNLRSAILPRLQNPIEVTISDIERLNSSLHYHFIWTEENQKRNRFQALLKSIAKDNPSHLQLPLVVMCQSRLETVEAKTVLEAFSPSLRFRCVTVETPADARRTALTQLGDGSLDVLVATMGIVGRGVELRRCRSLVLWSLPSSIAELIHQCGRIGRDGAEGAVVCFFNAKNKKVFKGLVRLCEEAHIKLPKKVKEELKNEELANPRLTVGELKRMGLFSEAAALQWKEFRKWRVC
ncbi:hypothetical protein WA577_002652 [Blastocystis sp. JDR]